MADADELADLRDEVVRLTGVNVDIRAQLHEALGVCAKQEAACTTAARVLDVTRSDNVRLASKLERAEAQRDHAAALLCQVTGVHLTFDQEQPDGH
jgi:hypothetical protein